MPGNQQSSALSRDAPPEHGELAFELAGISHHLVRPTTWAAESVPAEVVGQMFFAGEQHLILRPAAASDPAGAPMPLSRLLTHRELEIAVLIAEGLCDKQIARSLGISGHTVREHTRRTMAKLKVSKRTAIVCHVLGGLSQTRCADW